MSAEATKRKPDVTDLYQEVVVRHSRDPQGRGRLADATHDAFGTNPLCGDDVELTLVMDDAGRIVRVACDGDACALTIASASILTTAVRGLGPDEALGVIDVMEAACRGEITEISDCTELAALASVRDWPARVRCVTLPWETLRAALKGEAGPGARMRARQA